MKPNTKLLMSLFSVAFIQACSSGGDLSVDDLQFSSNEELIEFYDSAKGTSQANTHDLYVGRGTYALTFSSSCKNDRVYDGLSRLANGDSSEPQPTLTPAYYKNIFESGIIGVEHNISISAQQWQGHVTLVVAGWDSESSELSSATYSGKINEDGSFLALARNYHAVDNRNYQLDAVIGKITSDQIEIRGEGVIKFLDGKINDGEVKTFDYLKGIDCQAYVSQITLPIKRS